MNLLAVVNDIETCNACGGADVVRLLKFAWTIFDIVLIVIPIALILMITIDFGKNVLAGKEDDMKKNVNIVIKRLIYCVVLFLVPTIVSFAINLVNETANIQALACIDLVDSNTSEDLKQILPNCEVDYENLGGEISDEPEPDNEDIIVDNPIEVTISFNTNTGSPTSNITTPNNKTVIYGEKYGDLPILTRENYIFLGWFDRASNNGNLVTKDSIVRNENSHNLYAHWANLINVFFDVNGGKSWSLNQSGCKASDEIKHSFGSCYKIFTASQFENGTPKYGTLPTPTRKGYEFLGWYTANHGGKSVEENTKLVESREHTLYAHWRKEGEKNAENCYQCEVKGWYVWGSSKPKDVCMSEWEINYDITSKEACEYYNNQS